MSKKILVIDDDANLRSLLQAQLELRNYRVVSARSGKEGLQKAFETRPDLVLLDLMMEGLDGWQVCAHLRAMSDVPIIMLTARSMPGDVVRALENGADDYVTKPFGAAELTSRIKAVLRRRSKAPDNGRPRFSSYSNGHFTIDFDRRQVTVGERSADLTPTEFEILTCLVKHAGRVLPHQYIVNQVWGPEQSHNVDYVKLYIRSLREKIEEDPSDPQYILTEWGKGYLFARR
jgi:two-component system KDP operon response regulator KdpE